MTDLPPALAELIHDKQAKHAEEQIMVLVRQLQQDGIETRAIARALFRAMMDVSVQLSGNAQYRFLDNVSGAIRESLGAVDLLIETQDSTEH